MITIQRETKETRIQCKLEVRPENQTAQADIDTGLPFFDHMLEQLATHAGWQLSIQMQADLEVDDHHGIEDVAICLGQALEQSWNQYSPNQRYGQRLLPMDEALTLCAVDLCGRAHAVLDLPFSQPMLGGIHTEMWDHFFYTLAINARICLHLKNMYFRNNHHLVESAFKALAHALQEALQPRKSEKTTKGML